MKSVSERLKCARESREFDLVTEIARIDAESCVVQAIIRVDGVIKATGHACEFRKNNIAYVEIAETCAVGRALAFAGFCDLEGGIATTDELAKALKEEVEDSHQQQMTLDEALQTRTKSGKRYADLDDSNLEYILDKASNEKSREAARIVLNHRNK